MGVGSVRVEQRIAREFYYVTLRPEPIMSNFKPLESSIDTEKVRKPSDIPTLAPLGQDKDMLPNQPKNPNYTIAFIV